MRQRPLFSFRPQYTTFNIFKHIIHFETLMILSSTSGLGSSALPLNFDSINYKKHKCCFGNLKASLTLNINFTWLAYDVCIRASDNLWIDISQVMTSEKEIIYTMFQRYENYIVLLLLFEFYIILPSTFILPSSTHIYHVDLWWQTKFD